MKEQILNTISEMIRIPSVSGNQKEIARILQYCRDFFAGSDAVIREFCYQDASPVMVVANCEGDVFDLMILGHLDVVPAEPETFIPRIEGNRLYGRGSGDMKGQMAVAMYNLRHVLERRLPLRMALMITTDEETTSNGIKAIARHTAIRPTVTLDCDAGNLHTLVEKYKHSVGVKLTAAGCGGHSSTPWLGLNAVDGLMEAIAKIRRHFPQFSNREPTPENTWVDTMTVTSFTSPVTVNVIPAHAEALLNFRLTDRLSLDGLKKIIADACAESICSFEVTMSSCGCYMDAENPLIRLYRQTAKEILGQPLKIGHMNGATDARILADRTTVVMHSFDSEHLHHKDEYAEIDSIFKFMEIQRQFIEKLAAQKALPQPAAASKP